MEEKELRLREYFKGECIQYYCPECRKGLMKFDDIIGDGVEVYKCEHCGHKISLDEHQGDFVYEQIDEFIKHLHEQSCPNCKSLDRFIMYGKCGGEILVHCNRCHNDFRLVECGEEDNTEWKLEICNGKILLTEKLPKDNSQPDTKWYEKMIEELISENRKKELIINILLDRIEALQGREEIK